MTDVGCADSSFAPGLHRRFLGDHNIAAPRVVNYPALVIEAQDRRKIIQELNHRKNKTQKKNQEKKKLFPFISSHTARR